MKLNAEETLLILAGLDYLCGDGVDGAAELRKRVGRYRHFLARAAERDAAEMEVQAAYKSYQAVCKRYHALIDGMSALVREQEQA